MSGFLRIPVELASAAIFTPSVALTNGKATRGMALGRSELDLVEKITSCGVFVVMRNMEEIKSSGLIVD